jgi:hypothetical protein
MLKIDGDGPVAPKPRNNVKERYEQASVSLASALRAALPITLAARSFPQEMSGMMIKEARARKIPSLLSPGVSCCQSVHPACPSTYSARAKSLVESD